MSPKKYLQFTASQLEEIKTIDYSPSGRSPLLGTL